MACFVYGCSGQVFFQVKDGLTHVESVMRPLLTCNDHLGDALGNVSKVLAMNVGDSATLEVTRLAIRVAAN